MTTTRFTVRSGHAVLHGDVRGEHGPLLVFLHAGVADRRCWKAVMSELSDGFRCAAYDRRGFGDTTYAEEPHSHTDDLAAVLDALAVQGAQEAEPAILVGNSQGGRIAIDFALAHPERVRALALVAAAISGSVPVDPPPGSAEDVLDGAIDEADEAGDLERLNELEAHFWLDGPASHAGRVGGAARELFLDMNGRALRAAPTGAPREGPGAVERVGKLALPMHVVVGSRDVDAIVESSRWLAGQVPDATLTELDDAAHLPQMENPKAFTEDLRAFLARIRPRA